MTARESSSQYSAFHFDSVLFASCRFITSSFSAMTFKSSAGASMTVSPNNVLTGVSSASETEISISASGTDSPRSHLDTVCRTTFSLIASSSCESPLAFQMILIFSFRIMSNLLLIVAIILCEPARCRKQRMITWAISAKTSPSIYGYANSPKCDRIAYTFYTRRKLCFQQPFPLHYMSCRLFC